MGINWFLTPTTSRTKIKLKYVKDLYMKGKIIVSCLRKQLKRIYSQTWQRQRFLEEDNQKALTLSNIWQKLTLKWRISVHQYTLFTSGGLSLECEVNHPFRLKGWVGCVWCGFTQKCVGRGTKLASSIQGLLLQMSSTQYTAQDQTEQV